MSHKITLDRSIFHGKNFRRLAESSIRERCKAGEYVVHHSSVLIEETLRLWWKVQRPADFRSQLQFLTDIGNGAWFRPRRELLLLELSGPERPGNYPFLPGEQERALKSNLPRGPEEVLDTEERHKIQRERRRFCKDRAALKKTLVAIRGQSEEAKNAHAKSRSGDFESYCEAFADEAAASLIETDIGVRRDPQRVAGKWRTNKQNYPYFTLWVKMVLYWDYYARTESNRRIDLNTQMDSALLLIAKDLDIVVSNDRRFMKSMFSKIYSQGKEYLSLDEFLERML